MIDAPFEAPLLVSVFLTVTASGRTVLNIAVEGKEPLRCLISRDQLFALNKNIVDALCHTKNYHEVKANQATKETESGA